MRPVMNSVVEAIGETPLVRLDRLTRHLRVSGTILAKLDYLNPGFSKKDRAALGIIEEAERSGALQPGQTVVELTSGNMGTGLAIVCGIRGYPFIAVMSKGNSEERARMMRALGAEVVLVDQLPGSVPGQVSGGDLELVDREAKRITQERGAFRADQFNRDGNWLAHYRTTGPELWEQSGGAIDAFVDFIGSGGSYAGVTSALKAQPGCALLCGRAGGGGSCGGRGRHQARPSDPGRRLCNGRSRLPEGGAGRRLPTGDGRPGARDDASVGAP